MAKVFKKVYTGQGYGTIYNDLIAFDNRITGTGTTNQISVNDKLTILLREYPQVNIGGVNHDSNKGVATNCIVVAVASNNFILIKFIDWSSSNSTVVMWINDNGLDLGGWVNVQSQNYGVNNLAFYNCDGGAITSYSIPKLINYAEESNKIAYSTIAPLVNGGVISSNFEGLLSCSTTTLDSTVSLPNGKNYFTIGSNHMVEIDA